MKNMKKILSLLLTVAMIVGIGCYAATQVKAAENPKYMAKFVPGNKGRVYNNFAFEADSVYIFTCKYYAEAVEKANFQVRFSASFGEQVLDQALGTGEYEGRNTGYGGKNETKELTVKYKTTTETSLAICLENTNSSAGNNYYFWDMKVCKEGSNENLLVNADFTEGDGTWIGWRLAGYSNTTIANATQSGEATTATEHTVVDYDPEKCGDYSDMASYTWDATEKKFTFEYDGELNLSTYTRYHVQKDGAAFLGWAYVNGEDITWLTTDELDGYTFKAGDVIQAQYLEFDSDAKDENQIADFAIRSEEMRTDDSLGVRFIVELSNSLMENLPNADEFGTIVLPSKILDETGWTMNDSEGIEYSGKWADLTYDGTYGDEIKPEIVKAKNIYQTLDDRIYYTLCIKDITEDKYDRQYTVKGYIKYTDYNGVQQILYTDYASTNAYLVSKADLEKADVSEETRDVLQPIVNTVNTTYAEERATLDSTKTQITDADAELIGTPGANETIYKLTSGTKTFRIRELTFNFGLKNPLEIIHLSDLHWNYLNAFDIADSDPTLLATYGVRKTDWSDSVQGGWINNGRLLLEYARTADELVITGDVMDYLSKGAAELVHREIWDKYPNTIMALGNHEISQKVSNTVAETMSRENRFAWISQIWKYKNNSHYSSKLVGDKVMLIQMDNSENVFHETQYQQLSADIALAKTEGYKIFIFVHEPLTTGNSADTAVVPILTGGDYKTAANTYDFYTKKDDSNIHPDKGGATATVYNLITSSSDVIKGVFSGHIHGNFYSEILATNEDGTFVKDVEENYVTIPQYTVGAGYNRDMIKIIVE